MNHIERIRAVTARFFNVPESEVTEAYVFPPGRLAGSVGRHTFRAALKRLAGADVPAALTATTFAELIQSGPASVPMPQVEAAPIPLPTPPVLSPAERPASRAAEIGVDIEEAETLPWSGDPWSEPFYTENFSRAEIAYCTRQTDPRLSLCGLWAAKEAVMKCASGVRKLTPAEVEIGHDSDRRPFVRPDGAAAEEFLRNCRVSISHQGKIAVAVCVWTPEPARKEAGTAKAQALVSPAPAAAPGGLSTLAAWLGLLLGLTSLALWASSWIHRQ